MERLAYKPHLDDVLARLGLLYERQAQDRILATMQVPSAALSAFARQYPGTSCEYPAPESRILFWDALLRERAALEDDSVPSVYLSEFDQGLYAGVLGGQVEFMCHPENGWISSMVKPLLSDWSEFDALHIDLNHPWFRRYRHQLAIFRQHAQGKFGISHFILIDGLNFVFELLGATRTYLSLLEQPDRVRRAIAFAYELNVLIQDTFFESVSAESGGTYSNMVQWLPGRVISESVDPFHMTSVAYFETWGREPVQRMFQHYDGGVLHLHGNGRHLLEAVCTLKGLRAIYMGDDKDFAPAFDILPALRARAGDTPLVVSVDLARFEQGLHAHTLSGEVLYQVQGVPTVATANRLMEQVRAYRL